MGSLDPEYIPQLTLGWEVLAWATGNLVIPDGERQGEPWVFMPDQALFVLRWYAVDKRGKWLYRRAYRERSKGSGKSPMVAAIACAELLGPVLFSHFDSRGNPIGKPHPNPLVQIAAGAESQTDQTMILIADMLGHGPAAANYDLDIGLSRILVPGQRRRIEKVTANFRSREGARPTFVIMEETAGWTPTEKGPEFAGVLRRNLAKVGGRSIEVTNAPIPGEGTVAEETHSFWKMIKSGQAKDEGLLFDSESVHVDDLSDRDEVLPALQKMYRNAPWVDLERLFAEIQDPATRDVDARRFYFNEMVDPTALWISAGVWKSAERQTKLKKTDLISLGFRIRKSCAAIVAVRLKDQAIFVLEKWERPGNAGRDWEVPYAKIDEKMRRILDRYNAYNVVASPENFQDIIGRWSIDYEGDVEVEELWVSRNRQKWADSIEAFETAVSNQRLVHDGNTDLERHVMNCFVDEVTQGRIIRMETTHSNRYIVLAEAAVLAARASMEAIEDGALKEGPSNVFYSFS